MPKGYKDPGNIAAELIMSRMQHKGSFLIVEGSDDLRFWRHRKHSECELVEGEGKANVVGGIEHLNGTGFQGALGVVDDDYDSLLGKWNPLPNLVATDSHDLECLLCRSTALDKVLGEFGNHHKLRRFQDRYETDARTALRDRSAAIGRVRWAARRLEIAIDNHALRIPRLVDEGTWQVNTEQLMSAVKEDHVKRLKLEVDALPAADPWRVAKGHDMIEILRIGLKKVLGDISATLGSKEIARSLRLAMPVDELKQTRFGQDIQDWESSNPPYAILPTQSPDF